MPQAVCVGFSRSCAATACAKRSRFLAILPVSAIAQPQGSAALENRVDDVPLTPPPVERRLPAKQDARGRVTERLEGRSLVYAHSLRGPSGADRQDSKGTRGDW